MSTKKISIGTKPTAKPAPMAADAWVESRVPAEGPEPDGAPTASACG